MIMLGLQFGGALTTNRVRRRKLLFIVEGIVSRLIYVPMSLLPLWLGGELGNTQLVLAMIAMLALNLFYQFFLHTELAPHFGPLEWVFNTPRHHSVHHASNGSCLDKNFGGFLIIFDRLFGTFAAPPKDEPLRYGLTEPLESQNPLYVVFREWLQMAADLRRARSARDVWRTLFGAPGAVTHNKNGEKL
jgi:sterol desaturase/sphingolipid hydroxylase (fatty acid hydroxylase superfamily)